MNVSVTEIEELRGRLILLVFNKDIDSLPYEGRLYNVDPSTGSIILFNYTEQSKVTFKVFPKNTIKSVHGE
jgi:hypothetical protein